MVYPKQLVLLPRHEQKEMPRQSVLLTNSELISQESWDQKTSEPIHKHESVCCGRKLALLAPNTQMESDVICISIQAYLDCIKLNPTLRRKEGGKSSLVLTHPPRATVNRHEGFRHRIKQGDRHSLCSVTLAP